MPFNPFDNYPMSWKPRLSLNKESIYAELAEKLQSDIENGILLPGTKLPPQRELADFLDVNVSTVKKAFKICSQNGLISSVIGSGTFISYGALANTTLLSEENPEFLIEMGATVPERSANKDLLFLLRNMINENDADRWFRYNRPGENEWQKEAGVKLFYKLGLHIKKENVLFANGGQNALNAILSGVFRPNDKIAVDPHVYAGIKTAAKAHCIKLIPIQHKNGEMSSDALRNACANEELKGIYLIPTHQNPTTHNMTKDSRKEITKVIKEYGLILIEDGTYNLMTKDVPVISDSVPEQSIFIASLSKVVAPGLRMAYLAVPQKLRNAISESLYNLNVSISPLMAELSSRIVVSGMLDYVLAKHIEETRKRNEIVNHILGVSYHCLGEDTCIFRWLKLSDKCSGAKFENMARNAGVEVYAAERFAVGQAEPEHAVRLAICAPETEQELEKGLIIIKDLLKDI
ncbi:Histidinol-phosphate aminotransferase [bioreactor metagenome]|uniref:Histidinol-phosphate aminotransferase n=1 Tax=bioreactor metagenome TaxID=1076179 RepID=A0A644YMT9_9ZZZZ